MKKSFIYIILCILLLNFFSSCEDEKVGIKEGELVYKITYPQDERNNSLIALLPKTIKIRFKDNNTVAYIEGFWGTFQLRFITDRRNNKSYTVLRILDKKYVSISDIDSLSAGYEALPLQIDEHPEDTIILCGLLCYEADVVCRQLSDSIMKVYYTKDIDIKSPNSNTPFKDIDGVLTKFQTRVAGIDMIFELEEFNKCKVDDSEFDLPEGYKIIPAKELNEYLQSFQQD